MVSVIVPVYQVEAYLNRCVDSILRQSYENLQVLLVDDGSRDASGAICDEYAAKDSRVRVIHKENGGLSDARNAGLSAATGEYVMFVDGDDYIHPQMVQVLLDGMVAQEADIACCGIDFFSDMPQERPVTGQFRRYNVWQEMAISPEFSVCNRLLRRELFSQLRFPVGRLFEDQFVIFKLLGSGKVVHTADRLYFYFQRFDGLSKQRVYAETYDLLDAALELLRDIPAEQKQCRRAFTEMAVKRIGLMLGNAFYRDGQYQNCRIPKVSERVRQNMGLLTCSATLWEKWMLAQVAKGQGTAFQLLVKSYLKPGAAMKNKIKRVLKIG